MITSIKGKQTEITQLSVYNGSVDFNRYWSEYEEGFGNLPVDDSILANILNCHYRWMGTIQM